MHVCWRDAKNSIFPPDTLFYGIYRDGWKNHNLRAWRTWSWVSSRLENVKQLLQPCAVVCSSLQLFAIGWGGGGSECKKSNQGGKKSVLREFAKFDFCSNISLDWHFIFLFPKKKCIFLPLWKLKTIWGFHDALLAKNYVTRQHIDGCLRTGLGIFCFVSLATLFLLKVDFFSPGHNISWENVNQFVFLEILIFFSWSQYFLERCEMFFFFFKSAFSWLTWQIATKVLGGFFWNSISCRNFPRISLKFFFCSCFHKIVNIISCRISKTL